MSEINDTQKLLKIQKCQARMARDAYLKNKPKVWKQLDHLQQQQRAVLDSDEQVSPQSRFKTKKQQNKADKKKLFKINTVKQYQQALKKHRSQQRRFCNPYEPQILHLDAIQTIKELQSAKKQQLQIPYALKSVGIKSLKTICYGGAKKQFDIVIQFLKTGNIPKWMFQDYRQLLKKNPKQFRGTVKSLIRYQ